MGKSFVFNFGLPAFLPFLFLLLPGLVRAEIVQIDVRSESVVNKMFYTVGDIAHVSSSDAAIIKQIAGMQFGMSPRPGTSHKITKSSIMARLGQYMSTHDVRVHTPNNAIVSRKSIKIVSAQIESILLSKLRKNQYATETHYKPVSPIRDVFLPEGRFDYRVSELVSGKNIPIMSYRIDFLINGQKEKTINYTFQSSAPSINNQTPITPRANGNARLSNAVRRVDVNPTPVSNQKRQFQSDITVKSGHRIKIIFDHGAIRLVAEGIATESGGEGELISVVNVDSKKVIVGKIINSNTVVVL